VWKDDTIVGHVPQEIYRVCWFFLRKSGSEIACQIDGNRRQSAVEGKGLVVPCVYVFKGRQKHLDRLISVFAEVEVPS
jgi:hypothetical protein